MSPDAVTFFLVVLAWLTLARAILVLAHKLPPICHTCWRRLERRYLGETICSCDAGATTPARRGAS